MATLSSSAQSPDEEDEDKGRKEDATLLADTSFAKKSKSLKSWCKEVKDGLKSKLSRHHLSVSDQSNLANGARLLSVSVLDPDLDCRLKRVNAIKVSSSSDVNSSIPCYRAIKPHKTAKHKNDLLLWTRTFHLLFTIFLITVSLSLFIVEFIFLYCVHLF